MMCASWTTADCKHDGRCACASPRCRGRPPHGLRAFLYTTSMRRIKLGPPDYWDSIDLKQGSYSRSSKGEAVRILSIKLGGSHTSEGSCPAVCWRGLFCSKVPCRQRAEVSYDVRPEGRHARVVYWWF